MTASKEKALRWAAALLSTGLTGLLGVAILSFGGYSLRRPWKEWQSPVYKKEAISIFAKPVMDNAGHAASPIDSGDQVDNPITKFAVESAPDGYLRYPNPEFGWLSPPHAVTFSLPSAMNTMAKDQRPLRMVANNYGFHDDDFVKSKKKGEYRIGFFGGSVAHLGSGVEATIARQTQRALHQRDFTNVRCLNFGYTSYNVCQELAVYAQLAVDFDLDMVVLFSGCNDLASPYYYDPRPGYRFNSYAVEAKALGVSPEQMKETLDRKVGKGSAAWRQRLVETYLATVARFRRLTPRETPFLLVPQPMRVHQKQTHLADAAATDEYDRHVLACWDLLFETLQKDAGSRGITVSDVRAVFRDKPEVSYWDWCHFNDVGNQIVGQRLAGEVAALMNR